MSHGTWQLWECYHLLKLDHALKRQATLQRLVSGVQTRFEARERMQMVLDEKQALLAQVEAELVRLLGA